MRVLVAAAAAVLVLAGCSGGDEKDAQKPAEVEATESTSEQGDLSAPGPEQRAALVKALKDVDRRLAGSEERVVEDAMATCLDLLIPEDRTGRSIVTAAQLRFSGQIELTEDQTRKVVTAVRDHVCPDAAWP